MKYFDVLFVVPGGHKRCFNSLLMIFPLLNRRFWRDYSLIIWNEGCSVKIIDAQLKI